jgi:Zn-dependent peptidase ImmA (M78 family)/plasmid maintenance system antidote protein VapI
LATKSLSVDEFAKILGTNSVFVQNLLLGNISINDEIATKLHLNLGSTKQFWLNREYYYQIRIKELEQKWIEQLPIKDMYRLGWIEKTENTLKAVLGFFNVSSFMEWKNKYCNAVNLTAFRKSSKLESNLYSISAWLRQGEIKSQFIDCKNWNPNLLRERLQELRQLSKLKNPKDFIPKMKEICAECGVALVILRTPAGCPASGATKFLSDKKAVILLSFRFLSDDQFWFTFFHEIGHLLLHKDKTLFIEEANYNSIEEEEANNFSQDILIPKELQSRLKKMPANQIEIKKLSKDADISLGIIVGQLQHLNRLDMRFLNGFKRRYDIKDIMAAIH